VVTDVEVGAPVAKNMSVFSLFFFPALGGLLYG